MHGDLFDGPLPPDARTQPARTEPAWPGYDAAPPPPLTQRVLKRLLRRRTDARHAA
jgi:hypothetical protein